MLGTIPAMDEELARAVVRCDAGSEGCTIQDAAPERDKIPSLEEHSKEEGDGRQKKGGNVMNDDDDEDDASSGPSRERINTATSGGSLDEWCVMSEASVNREIFQDLQSHDEISQLASSLVTRDLLKQAEDQVSTKLVDQIFRSIQVRTINTRLSL
eukprot:XP_011661862.1 PREDICTED: uncharacterized protein LOC105437219 [Strongylocentrotus purpuratus]